MKVARLVLRCGEVRLCSLEPHADLPNWWHAQRIAGHIVGNNWACPFDEVRLADIVDIDNEQEEEQPAIPADRNPSLRALSFGLSRGLFKPDEQT